MYPDRVSAPTLSLKHCPCGNLRPYAECCGRLHGGEPADSAVRLMRARYTAYVLRLPEYLLATWHVSTRPTQLELPVEEGLRWQGLDVHAQQQAGDSARVEFIARFRLGQGPVQQQHEVSRFLREQSRWFYLDGEFPVPKSAQIAKPK